MKGVALIIFAVVLAVAALAARPAEAISCSDVQGALNPCLGYLTGGGGPSSQCCNGIRGLKSRVYSKQDRQTVCNCLKSAASGYNIRRDAAASLPGKCGVSLPYTVSPNIDCSKIS